MITFHLKYRQVRYYDLHHIIKEAEIRETMICPKSHRKLRSQNENSEPVLFLQHQHPPRCVGRTLIKETNTCFINIGVCW